MSPNILRVNISKFWEICIVVNETVVNLPKDAWRKDKARAYKLFCLMLASCAWIRNDHQAIGDVINAMGHMD